MPLQVFLVGGIVFFYVGEDTEVKKNKQRNEYFNVSC